MKKTMTCKELGGVCEKAFTADTVEELVEMCRDHIVEMVSMNNPDYMEAMDRMQKLLNNPEAMEEWFAYTRNIYESR